MDSTQFSFKYYEDPPMLEKEACSMAYQILEAHPDSSNLMESLASSDLKTEEEHLNIKIVAALICVMPMYYL